MTKKNMNIKKEIIKFRSKVITLKKRKEKAEYTYIDAEKTLAELKVEEKYMKLKPQFITVKTARKKGFTRKQTDLPAYKQPSKPLNFTPKKNIFNSGTNMTTPQSFPVEYPPLKNSLDEPPSDEPPSVVSPSVESFNFTSNNKSKSNFKFANANANAVKNANANAVKNANAAAAIASKNAAEASAAESAAESAAAEAAESAATINAETASTESAAKNDETAAKNDETAAKNAETAAKNAEIASTNAEIASKNEQSANKNMGSASMVAKTANTNMGSEEEEEVPEIEPLPVTPSDESEL